MEKYAYSAQAYNAHEMHGDSGHELGGESKGAPMMGAAGGKQGMNVFAHELDGGSARPGVHGAEGNGMAKYPV